MLGSGTLVTDNSNHTYRLEQMLGEGVTSRVYQAVDVETQQHVALKILRQDVSSEIVTSFWSEGDILGELHRAEQEKDDGLHNVPTFLGSKRDGDPQFIILELVQGRALDELLLEQGWLDEVEALHISAQVLRVVDLLHTRVQRSYTDLQLKNIWRLHPEPAHNGSIKIMDWNHVSAKPPEGQELASELVLADLRRYGAYMYRICTGKGASEGGESETALRTRAGARWLELAPRTREIIVRALNPQPRESFASAAEFRAAVQSQLDAWQIDWADHLSRAQILLNDEEWDDTRANQVDNALFLAERTGAEKDKVDYYRAKLQERRGAISVAWKAGEMLYQGGYYATAAQKWLPEVEARDRLDLWHWWVAASAGAELGKEKFTALRPQVEEAIQALERAALPQALDWLEQVKQAGGECEPIEWLERETSARMLVIQARTRGESSELELWQKALKDFETAGNLLTSLPYQALIRQQENWGRFESETEILKKKIRLRRQTLKRLAEIETHLRNQDSLVKGITELVALLRQDPANPDLAQFCLTQAKNFLEKGQSRQAQEIARVGLFEGQASDLDVSLREIVLRAEQAQEMQRIQTAQQAEQNLQAQKQAEEKKRQRLELEAKLTEIEAALKHADYVRMLHTILDIPRTQIPKELSKRWQTIGETVWARYNEVAELKALPLMDSLGRILAVMDPDPSRVAARQKEYVEAARSIETMQLNWERTFLESIRRRQINIAVHQVPKLTQEIENGLYWTTDATIRAELEKIRNELLNAKTTQPIVPAAPLQATRAPATAMNPVNHALLNELDALRQENQELKSKISELEKEAENLRAVHSPLHAQKPAESHAFMSQPDSAIEQLRARVAELEKVNRELEGKLAASENSRSTLSQDYAGERERFASILLERDIARGGLESANVRILELEAKLSSIASTSARHSRQIETNTSLAAHVISEDELKNKIRHALDRIQELTPASLDQAKQELIDLENHLQTNTTNPELFRSVQKGLQLIHILARPMGKEATQILQPMSRNDKLVEQMITHPTWESFTKEVPFVEWNARAGQRFETAKELAQKARATKQKTLFEQSQNHLHSTIATTKGIIKIFGEKWRLAFDGITFIEPNPRLEEIQRMRNGAETLLVEIETEIRRTKRISIVQR